MTEYGQNWKMKSGDKRELVIENIVGMVTGTIRWGASTGYGQPVIIGPKSSATGQIVTTYDAATNLTTLRVYLLPADTSNLAQRAPLRLIHEAEELTPEGPLTLSEGFMTIIPDILT